MERKIHRTCIEFFAQVANPQGIVPQKLGGQAEVGQQL